MPKLGTTLSAAVRTGTTITTTNTVATFRTVVHSFHCCGPPALSTIPKGLYSSIGRGQAFIVRALSACLLLAFAGGASAFSVGRQSRSPGPRLAGPHRAPLGGALNASEETPGICACAVNPDCVIADVPAQVHDRNVSRAEELNSAILSRLDVKFGSSSEHLKEVTKVARDFFSSGTNFGGIFDLSEFTRSEDSVPKDSKIEIKYNTIKSCITPIDIAVLAYSHKGVDYLAIDAKSESLVARTYMALTLSLIHCKPLSQVKSLLEANLERYERLSKFSPFSREALYGQILKFLNCLPKASPKGTLSASKVCKPGYYGQFNFIRLIPKPISDVNRFYKSVYGFEPKAFWSPPIKKVAALVSGGVDSSVALWLLKSQGFDVHAFYLKLFDDDSMQCTQSDDIRYATECCNILGVPLHVLPISEIYRKGVFDYMINAYRKGETPNPDVMCNKNVKFGAFLDTAISDFGFDYVASGHYASVSDTGFFFDFSCSDTHQLEPSEPNCPESNLNFSDALNGASADWNSKSLEPDLMASDLEDLNEPDLMASDLEEANGAIGASGQDGPDSKVYKSKINNTCIKRIVYSQLMMHDDFKKDQTYFLSRLSYNQLKNVIFPLKNLKKSYVRELAKLNGLPTYLRKDSMGICFLGKMNISQFLSGYLGESPGDIVDYYTKKVIGRHSGLYNFTIGQRKNLPHFLYPESCNTKSYQPNYFVVSKDIGSNTLYVARQCDSTNLSNEGGPHRSFALMHIRWNNPLFQLRNHVSDEHYCPAVWEPEITPEDVRDVQQLTLGGYGFKRTDLLIKVRSTGGIIPSTVLLSNPISNSSDGCITQHGWVTLNESDMGIATGQYAAIYRRNCCLGSGIIMQSL